MNILLGLFLIFMPLLIMPGVRELWWEDAPPPLSYGTPVAAINWLAQHETLPGKMWSDIHLASYQIYALPSRPVWIDTRIQVVYPPAMFDEYFAIATASSVWGELLEEYDINLLLLSTVSEPRLVTALEETPEWCRLYEDGTALVYARNQGDEGCPQ